MLFNNLLQKVLHSDLINLPTITHGILNIYFKCLLLIKGKPTSNFFVTLTRRDETPLIVVTLSIAIVIKAKI